METAGALANVQLPDPQLYTYYINLDERKIWLDYDIDENTLEVVKQILRWNKEDAGKEPSDRKPIKIYIYCIGGKNEPSIALINVCEISVTPIYTYNIGLAMSNGLDILLAGHKRFCLCGSSALIHSGSVGMAGTSEQVKSASDNYTKQLKWYEDYELRRTTITKAEFKKHKGKDWYLSAEEQLKFGVVNQIISDISDLL